MNEPRHPDVPARRGRFTPAVVVVLCLLGVWVSVRVYGNLQIRHDPPAPCVLFGGHWGIWSGWSCG